MYKIEVYNKLSCHLMTERTFKEEQESNNYIVQIPSGCVWVLYEEESPLDYGEGQC